MIALEARYTSPPLSRKRGLSLLVIVDICGHDYIEEGDRKVVTFGTYPKACSYVVR